MPIDNSSLKTPLGKQATDGPGEVLQRLKRESLEDSIIVPLAREVCQTEINSLITMSRLYSPTSDSPHGTNTSAGFMSGQGDGVSFARHVTQPRQDESETLEQKSDVGTKHDQEKPTLAFIPKAALYAEGQAFAFGAKKYDSWNYKHGIKVSRTLSAALRHIMQFLDGEDNDQESGAHHLGCARANLAMALDTLANHPEMDDRFKEKK